MRTQFFVASIALVAVSLVNATRLDSANLLDAGQYDPITFAEVDAPSNVDSEIEGQGGNEGT